MTSAGRLEGRGGTVSGTISVAIATYNGARYLTEQLDSIAAQTLLPDEVVIGDDCSSDDSVALVTDFAKRAPFPVTLIRHPHNIGILENFYAAFEATAGNLIFYCDQDDVWHPDKIRRMTAALRPGTMLAMHQSLIVGPNLEPHDRIAPGNRRYGRFAFPVDSGAVHGYGHQMAFRREVLTLMQQLRPKIEAIRPGSFTHDFDQFVPFCASLLGDLSVLADPLVQFRRHATATSPAGTTSKCEQAPGDLTARARFLIHRDATSSALRLAIVRQAAAYRLITPPSSTKLIRAFAAKTRLATGQRELLEDRRAVLSRLVSSGALLAAFRPPGFSNARPLRAVALALFAALTPRPPALTAATVARARRN